MNRFGWLSLILVLILSPDLIGAEPKSAKKNDLRVLLVGHNPDDPKVMFRQLATERTFRLHRERTAAFEALLRYHFERVTVVYADDYLPKMSDDVDVTVFDVVPRVLTAEVREFDEDGKYNPNSYRAPSYLPESFDRPALLTAGVTPRVGEPLGLKLDWL